MNSRRNSGQLGIFTVLSVDVLRVGYEPPREVFRFGRKRSYFPSHAARIPSKIRALRTVLPQTEIGSYQSMLPFNR